MKVDVLRAREWVLANQAAILEALGPLSEVRSGGVAVDAVFILTTDPQESAAHDAMACSRLGSR